jgi:hypothetical protein
LERREGAVRILSGGDLAFEQLGVGFGLVITGASDPFDPTKIGTFGAVEFICQPLAVVTVEVAEVEARCPYAPETSLYRAGYLGAAASY